MAYDEILAQRFRDCIAPLGPVTEKRMMGGACFMVSGNMVGGADRQQDGSARFMFRVGKENEEEALARPGAIPIEQGGKRMGGMVFVHGDCTDQELNEWIKLAWSYVGTLRPN